MILFLVENLATILISIFILCIMIAVIRKMIKDKKNGKTCGCGNCGGCLGSSICHKK